MPLLFLISPTASGGYGSSCWKGDRFGGGNTGGCFLGFHFSHELRSKDNQLKLAGCGRRDWDLLFYHVFLPSLRGTLVSVWPLEDRQFVVN